MKEFKNAPITGCSVSGKCFCRLKAVLAWAQPAPNALNELKNITKPVLIAQGENDFLVPVNNTVKMSNSIPGAQLIVYRMQVTLPLINTMTISSRQY
jgi:pimeloyl-ACP methyl ester carboxylesterase